jgi:D-amino-acid dehydrogenase
MDVTHKVAITRLDDRLRIAGLAELSGWRSDLPTKRRTTLEWSATELFPNAADLADARFWCGLRPMTPDGPPIIGRVAFDNLYLNAGHGTLGWTMACGSAQLLSDLILSRTPDIDPNEFGLERDS